MTDSFRPFKCSTCSRSFTRQENLKRHTRTHHQGSLARTFHCTRCGSSFSRSDLRKRHMENCHAPIAATQSSSPENRPNGTTTPRTSTATAMQQDPRPVERAPMAADDRIGSGELPSETAYAFTFLAEFHRSFPLLHEASLNASTPPLALLRAMACIGALHGRSEHDRSVSRHLFKKGVEALGRFVNEDRSRYQQEWVLQAFILFEFYGLYCGDDMLFQKASTIHTNLVEAVRLFQMAQQAFLRKGDPAELPLDAETLTGASAEELQRKWQQFIIEETRKRCVYALYVLDSQRAILCNLRPLLSSLEIKHDLPCDEDLWLASTAEEWAGLMSHRFSSFNESEDFFAAEESLPESSFFESTHYLLHSQPTQKTPSKLKLLWSSPFAACILVTQLQMVSRELTHAACLLDRPTYQQRYLSLLTETQYAQISQALRSIAELVPREEQSSAGISDAGTNTQGFGSGSMWSLNCGFGGNPFSTSSPTATLSQARQTHPELWHYFWVMWHYTSITLSHPDALLVRGVVETSLPGAIATAGHLARPKPKSQRDIYEDRDVFRLLNSVDQCLRKLTVPASDSGADGAASTAVALDRASSAENPFATLLGFKTSLVGWRLVRLTMNDASRPSGFVLDTILRACAPSEPWNGLGLAGPEVKYLRALVQAFERRNAWPVGEWIGRVLGEMAQESETLEAMIDTALSETLNAEQPQ